MLINPVAPNKGSGARRSQERPGEARRGQERPGEARTGQERPGKATRGQGRPGEARRGQKRPGEARGGQEEPGDARRGQERPGEASRGQERPGEATRGQGRPGEARRGQERPGEARRGQETPGEARRGQGRPGEARVPGAPAGGDPTAAPEMSKDGANLCINPCCSEPGVRGPREARDPRRARRGQERPGRATTAMLSIGCAPLTDRHLGLCSVIDRLCPPYRSVLALLPIGPGSVPGALQYVRRAWTEGGWEVNGRRTEGAREWADLEHHFATVLRTGEDRLSTACQ